ncbi:MAG: hypothetical protein J5996_07100 [Prevotella sp.]|nr:hypothetical protein [Prevotella sp.]
MAQVRISVSDLNGTKWKIKSAVPSGYYEFTSGKMIWNHSKGTSVYLYYLTDRPVTDSDVSDFDRSRVGKSTKGSYLMELIQNDLGERNRCFHILSFDKKAGIMTMKMVTKGVLYSGDPTITYLLIK